MVSPTGPAPTMSTSVSFFMSAVPPGMAARLIYSTNHPAAPPGRGTMERARLPASHILQLALQETWQAAPAWTVAAQCFHLRATDLDRLARSDRPNGSRRP